MELNYTHPSGNKIDQIQSLHIYQTSRSSHELPASDALLKKGVWLYFLLLIFEGALRKWFLPGLATPLLVIRDPLALWLVYMTWKRGLLPSNPYLSGSVIIGIIGFYTAGLLGHGNIFVALYGARIYLLHFPLVFVIGRIFNKEDVIQMGKVILWISIPMALLTALQFYSPQSAWVNRGVGGDLEGAGFSGALGYFRPPGTFSFTTGNTSFFGLVAGFIFYFLLKPKEINRLLLIGASGALVLAIPLSISRSLFFQVIVTLLFTAYAVSRKPGYLGQLVLVSLGVVLGLAVLSQTSLFQTASEVFSTRFENANKIEGGLEGVLIDRYLGGLIGALANSSEHPLFGYGLGMGTKVGSMLLTGGLQYLIGEGEWSRVIGELGPILGLSAIFLRLGFCTKIATGSYQNLMSGNLLPWTLLSYALLVIPQSQWSQPTTLGFSTLIGGLMIASMRDFSEVRIG